MWGGGGLLGQQSGFTDKQAWGGGTGGDGTYVWRRKVGADRRFKNSRGSGEEGKGPKRRKEMKEVKEIQRKVDVRMNGWGWAQRMRLFLVGRGAQMSMRWGTKGHSEEANFFIKKMLDCEAGCCFQMDSSELVWYISNCGGGGGIFPWI